MNTEELEQFLESRRKSLSKQEYFDLVLHMLNQSPPKELRDILRINLLTYSHVDSDRVARYWEPLLSDLDPFQREVAALQLSTTLYEPNSLTDQILSKHLGVEAGTTTAEGQFDMIIKRMQKLFPGYDDKESQA